MFPYNQQVFILKIQAIITVSAVSLFLFCFFFQRKIAKCEKDKNKCLHAAENDFKAKLEYIVQHNNCMLGHRPTLTSPPSSTVASNLPPYKASVFGNLIMIS